MADEPELLPLEDHTAGQIRSALRSHAETVEPSNRVDEVVARASRLGGGGRRGRNLRWLVLAAVTALLVGLALPVLVPQFSLLGRGNARTAAPTVTTTANPGASPSLPTLQRNLPIYYVGADRRLYREFRDLPTQEDRLVTAVAAVLNVAPLDPSYGSLWAGGQVNSAEVVGTRIIVDISASAFQTFTSRQSAATAINQVVYTAIGAVGDAADKRSVQILMDGSPNLPVIGAPKADFTRDGLRPLGLVWLSSPQAGAELPAGEVTFSGLQQTTVDNATLNWQVLGDDGKVVRDGTVMATGNDAGWRSWRVTAVLAPGRYELRLWASGVSIQRRAFTVV